jgi:hypothetical protein
MYGILTFQRQKTAKKRDFDGFFTKIDKNTEFYRFFGKKWQKHDILPLFLQKKLQNRIFLTRFSQKICQCTASYPFVNRENFKISI